MSFIFPVPKVGGYTVILPCLFIDLIVHTPLPASYVDLRFYLSGSQGNT